jgi:hypothetical protein
LGQTSVGGFTGSSLSGSTYVASLSGADINGVLQGAGALAFNSGGTVGGVISYNDITVQNAQGGTAVTGGTWSVDASGTGRATLTGVTDGTVTLNMQLYLTGDGHATTMTMDAANLNPDELNGLSWQQASGLGVSTPSGNYALALDEFSSGAEFDGDGVASFASATTSITGFLDSNGSFLGKGLQPDTSIGATYTGASTNGVLDITGTGSSPSLYTFYLIDATQGVLIENDNGQLTLGYATNQ